MPAVAEYVRPQMYRAQEEAIFNDARYALVEASTKAGKTVACLVWLTEQAMRCAPSQNVWWVAPIFAQAKVAYRRLARMLPRDLRTLSETELRITLANGAHIWFKSGEKPDGLYSEDVHAAVIDEASRVREAAYHAIRSTLTHTRGPVRCIGNAKGRRNWFYRMARRAEAGEPDMHYARITWRDAVAAGVLDEAEIADAQRQLPEAVFRELYEAEASDDEGNPFGIDHIRACTAPLSDDDPAAWGVDLAKSTDWTAAIALDTQGQVCRLLRFQRSWEDTLLTLAGALRFTPAACDATGVGDPIVERLQRGSSRVTGYVFTSQSKQLLMEGLAVALQTREITFPPGVIAAELEQFEYVYSRTGVRYGAPEGCHDDTVCALALAVYQLRQGLQRPRVRVLEPDPQQGWHSWA